MTKKIVTCLVIVTCVIPLYSCSEEKYYERVPTRDVERALTPTHGFENNYSSSTESLPDRTTFFHPEQEQHKLIIQRRPLTRSEISWRAAKCVLGSLVLTGIGIGSYFLAENIMHEEHKVNDYLIGYNQSLTTITDQIAKLANLTETILGKL